MKYILFTVALLFSALCCADDVEMNASGNWRHAGYIENKITEDIYKIEFSAPRILFSSKPSWDGWNRRAKILCDGSAYRVLNKEEHLIGQITEITNQLFFVKAYAVCGTSNLSDSEAEKIIQEYLIPVVGVDEAVVNSCKNNNISNKESSFAEVERLMIKNRYDDALVCLSNIVSTENEEFINKKAYFQLGLIYELGLGVSSDMKLAMVYYKKSE